MCDHMNADLGLWFRPGAEAQMRLLSEAEDRLTTKARTIADSETLDSATEAAREAMATARNGLSWLAANPCPADDVGDPLARAWSALRNASRQLVWMAEGRSPMTPLSGEIVAYSIFLAHRRLYDASMAFAVAIAG